MGIYTRLLRCSLMFGVFFLFLLLFLFTGSVLQAGEITLLTPNEDCIVYNRSPFTHLVIKVSDEGDLKRLKLLAKEKEIGPLTTRRQKDSFFVHYRVPLDKGKNIFTLLPVKKKISIESRPYRALLDPKFDQTGVYLYHRQQTMMKECRPCHDVDTMPADSAVTPSPYGKAAPACYSCHKSLLENRKWLHGPAEHLLCESCHTQKKEGGRIAVKSGMDSFLCYGCHQPKDKALGDKVYSHPFMAFGTCSVCHDPHGSNYPLQLWADSKAEICVGCHVDKEVLVQKDSGGLFVHGIIKGGGCVVCHDAHASGSPFILYDTTNKLCVSCHIGYIGMTKGHPVGGHPLAGPSNPLDPDRAFDCASCHNAHGSKYKFLLVGDILGGHVCLQCHN